MACGRVRRAVAAGLSAGLFAACAASPPVPPVRPPVRPGAADDAAAAAPAIERANIDRFLRVEGDAFDWIAAADPRLAARAGATASEEVIKRIGTEAVLAEDATADVRGDSLDLFAFRGRERALARAADVLRACRVRLPETAPAGASLRRPRLERELLGRLLDEERARAVEEARLGSASGDLVRGILSTWTPMAAPQDWPDRDAWVSKHLLEIRDSLRDGPERTGPLDLDVALYPLERLLAPLEFPRGAAAIAEVRLALDADTRSSPPLADPAWLAGSLKIHLGLTVDPSGLPARLAGLEMRLRDLARQALGESASPPAALDRAAQLLFAEGPCPPVAGTRVRAMAPPPERALVCGALRALTGEADEAAALVALHDDVLLAFAGITTAPPPRTRLLSNPDNDRIDALERSARERPVPALGVALAAELLYEAGGASAPARLRAWRALGEAPLDVVAREMDASASSGAPREAHPATSG